MPQTCTYLTVITHVAIQLVDIMRALQKKRRKYIMFLILWSILHFSSRFSILYLTGVSGAGLWDVTVVHSVSTYHASLLILSQHEKGIR